MKILIISDIDPAGSQMGLVDPDLFRNLRQADLHGVVASGAECAALRHVQKVDRSTRNGDQLLLHIADRRNGTEQTLGVLVAGIVENILCSSALADSSAVHNNDLIGHLRDNAQIVCNDDDRRIPPDSS